MPVGSQRQRILQLRSIIININFLKRHHPQRTENKGKTQAVLKKGLEEPWGRPGTWLGAGPGGAMGYEPRALQSCLPLEGAISWPLFTRIRDEDQELRVGERGGSDIFLNS